MLYFCYFNDNSIMHSTINKAIYNIKSQNFLKQGLAYSLVYFEPCIRNNKVLSNFFIFEEFIGNKSK